MSGFCFKNNYLAYQIPELEGLAEGEEGGGRARKMELKLTFHISSAFVMHQMIKNMYYVLVHPLMKNKC